MARYQYIVLTSAVPGRLEEFESWYDTQHLKDVVAVPGVVSARRYKLLKNIDNSARKSGPTPWDSLAVYEFETDDPVALALKFTDLSGTEAMPLCDAMATSHVTIVAQEASTL